MLETILEKFIKLLKNKINAYCRKFEDQRIDLISKFKLKRSDNIAGTLLNLLSPNTELDVIALYNLIKIIGKECECWLSVSVDLIQLNYW